MALVGSAYCWTVEAGVVALANGLSGISAFSLAYSFCISALNSSADFVY